MKFLSDYFHLIQKNIEKNAIIEKSKKSRFFII